MTPTQKKIQDLQELQIKISEHLPCWKQPSERDGNISYDSEDRDSMVGSKETKEAVKCIGDAIVAILCIDIIYETKTVAKKTDK